MLRGNTIPGLAKPNFPRVYGFANRGLSRALSHRGCHKPVYLAISPIPIHVLRIVDNQAIKSNQLPAA